jgi:hypothetical protein
MPEGQPGSDGQSRMDRLERLLTDRVDKLAQTVTNLAEAQKHTDERLNALRTAAMNGLPGQAAQNSLR